MPKVATQRAAYGHGRALCRVGDSDVVSAPGSGPPHFGIGGAVADPPAGADRLYQLGPGRRNRSAEDGGSSLPSADEL
jgi:hypothetical protein